MKSWVEISAEKLAGNFQAVGRAAGRGSEVLCVIKANAYGHGATLCAPLLMQAGARWLGVSDRDEGIAIRQALGESEARILVMCGMETSDAAAIVLNDLTPIIWTAEHITALEQAARRMESRCSVHVEIDSGMSRQGVAPGPGLQHVLELLAKSEWLICEGVMSHLCCSETAGANTTTLQKERFDAALEQARAAGLHPEFIHLANTSAVDEGSTMGWLRETAYALDAKPMVRTGIALYGHCLPIDGPDAHAPELLPELQSVMQWKTHITALREIPAGATVGYGATYTAPHVMRIALLPVGYADGFRRAGSSGLGNGWVMIAEQRAPIVGRVSMNLTTVDITEIDDIAVGDEVVLLGEGVTVEDHARWSDTVPYDIFCGIKARFVAC